MWLWAGHAPQWLCSKMLNETYYAVMHVNIVAVPAWMAANQAYASCQIFAVSVNQCCAFSACDVSAESMGKMSNSSNEVVRIRQSTAEILLLHYPPYKLTHWTSWWKSFFAVCTYTLPLVCFHNASVQSLWPIVITSPTHQCTYMYVCIRMQMNSFFSYVHHL